MAQDKYLSFKNNLSGFSFANLGLFTGFADGIYNAVYSLVLLDIFRNSAVVGLYVALYSVFCLFVGLFANEIFRRFSKVRVFYFVLLMMAACYVMMSFSILPRTFIILDYASGISATLIGVLIPLFMADFSRNIGMARLNSRYHLWLNVGALFAPMVAVSVADFVGTNRSAFFASAIIYLLCWSVFRYFSVVQQDKQITPVDPSRTFKALWKNTKKFFKTPGLTRAYLVNFGYYSLRALRVLYVPIMVIEAGFSKDALGWVLTLGIIPYLLLSERMGKLAKQYGNKIWLTLGFLSFAGLSVIATFVSGYMLLAVFVAWQVSGALMESVHDLLFFDMVKKSQQTKFYGVFRTSVNLPSILVPVLGAGAIAMFGATSAVWWVTAVIGVLATVILLSGNK